MARRHAAYDGEAKFGIRSRITSLRRAKGSLSLTTGPARRQGLMSRWFEDVQWSMWFNIPTPARGGLNPARDNVVDRRHGGTRGKTKEERKVGRVSSMHIPELFSNSRHWGGARW